MRNAIQWNHLNTVTSSISLRRWLPFSCSWDVSQFISNNLFQNHTPGHTRQNTDINQWWKNSKHITLDSAIANTQGKVRGVNLYSWSCTKQCFVSLHRMLFSQQCTEQRPSKILLTRRIPEYQNFLRPYLTSKNKPKLTQRKRKRGRNPAPLALNTISLGHHRATCSNLSQIVTRHCLNYFRSRFKERKRNGMHTNCNGNSLYSFKQVKCK